jgi:hypothetical protein
VRRGQDPFRGWGLFLYSSGAKVPSICGRFWHGSSHAFTKLTASLHPHLAVNPRLQDLCLPPGLKPGLSATGFVYGLKPLSFNSSRNGGCCWFEGGVGESASDVEG